MDSGIRKIPRTVLLSIFGLSLFILSENCNAYTIAEVDGLRPGELVVEVFTLTEDMDVKIEAVGGAYKRLGGMLGYPWLLDAASRDVAWSMEDESTKRFKNNSFLRHFDDVLRLDAGTYELYYYAGHDWKFSIQIDDDEDEISGILDKLFDGDKKLSNEKLAREYFIRITSESDNYSLAGVDPGPKKAAIELTYPRNDEYLQQGFVLDRDMELEVYGIGEYSEWGEVMVDWGWITDAHSHERVWKMDRWDSRHAGGADKNHAFRETIELHAGEYIAYYVTDDSHSFEDWNDTPPYDPEGWGLRIYVSDPDDADAIRLEDVSSQETVLIALTRVCDNEYLSEGFQLTTPLDVHIYAIGEDDRYDDGLVDYGWIVDAADGDRIWVMDDDNTEYAGGASKNRKYDGVLTLDEGEYVVYYITDGSHSACDWNASAPYDKDSYGITLYIGDHEKEHVKPFDASKGPTNAIAAITCVGDNERRRERFSLTKVTRVRIKAIGEGDRDEMFDYAWIENADDGTVVWEMTPRKTSHAGGAEKNRMVDQKILLDKGRYIVYYVSDGSHSCQDWNASEPDNPHAWGIIITEVE